MLLFFYYIILFLFFALLCFFKNRADCGGTCWGKSLVVNPPCGGRRRKGGRTKEYCPQRWLSQRIISCVEREREGENVGFLLCSALRGTSHPVTQGFSLWWTLARRSQHITFSLQAQTWEPNLEVQMIISRLLYFAKMLAGVGCRLVSSLIFYW